MQHQSNNSNALFGLGYCNLGMLTKPDFSRLNALLYCLVHLNTTLFLSMVLRQAVTSAKNEYKFPVESDEA